MELVRNQCCELLKSDVSRPIKKDEQVVFVIHMYSVLVVQKNRIVKRIGTIWKLLRIGNTILFSTLFIYGVEDYLRSINKIEWNRQLQF